MSEYTPTTEEVRNRYLSEVFPEDEAEFDRWLAQIKAEAWERGHTAFEQAWESDNRFPYDYVTDNPYLEEAPNE